MKVFIELEVVSRKIRDNMIWNVEKEIFNIFHIISICDISKTIKYNGEEYEITNESIEKLLEYKL